MLISTGAVALSVATASWPRTRWPGSPSRSRTSLAFLFLSFRFAPFITFLIPLYLLFQRLGLYNTHLGLILAYQLITLPFTIWMLRSFFMEIPVEVEEAAQIDGCSWWVSSPG